MSQGADKRTRQLCHGENKQFVIHKSCERADLQHEMKVLDHRVQAKQLAVEHAIFLITGRELSAKKRQGLPGPPDKLHKSSSTAQSHASVVRATEASGTG